MKRVLMIAHTFPPEGSAGTYRPLRFVRHLTAAGWQPRVISAQKYQYERYDPDLLAQVPPDVEVVRVRGRDAWQAFQAWRAQRQQPAPSRAGENGPGDPSREGASFRSRMRNVVQTAERWRYHPDTAIKWIGPAVNAVITMCRREPADVMWATVGPVSSGIVALRASRATGIPYVVDFRDPWGLDYYDSEIRSPNWIKRLDRRTMHRVLSDARALVFQFPAVAECYSRAYPGALDGPKIHIIPNGYEGTLPDSTIPESSVCTVLYAGTLSTYYCYDSLLDGLRSLKRDRPALISRLRVLFVGDSMERFGNEVARHHLSDIVEIRGTVSHSDITRLEQDSQALLILGRDPKRQGHELVAGAKLFEYFKARRPIVAVVPRDETRNILSRVAPVLVADVDSARSIVEAFERLLEAWSAGRLASLLPDRAGCEAYSADRQTRALVRALEAGLPLDPYIPGSVHVPVSLLGVLGNAESPTRTYAWLGRRSGLGENRSVTQRAR